MSLKFRGRLMIAVESTCGFRILSAVQAGGGTGRRMTLTVGILTDTPLPSGVDQRVSSASGVCLPSTRSGVY